MGSNFEVRDDCASDGSAPVEVAFEFTKVGVLASTKKKPGAAAPTCVSIWRPLCWPRFTQ